MNLLPNTFKNFNKKDGITMLEVLIVITITAIISASAITFSTNFLTINNFKNKSNELITLLRTAQINSLSGKEDSSWGVKVSVSPNKIILFKGDSYDTRTQAFDTSFDIPQTVTITPSEIVFGKLTGNPNSTVTINIQSSIGDSNVVKVNEIGIVDVN